jgi:endonuclease VIII
VPEGDNLARIAAVLGELLVGRRVVSAEARSGARLERLVGRSVSGVAARGKHLLIDFSGGLTLHTHLGLHGSWHRYRTGERWRRPRSRAAAVLEVEGTTCVCFDSPTVELIETRALGLHPVLSRLGPDVGAPGFDAREALGRLRQPSLAGRALGEALLDQRLVAGLGNVYRSELCFLVGLHPRTPLGGVPDETLEAARIDGASEIQVFWRVVVPQIKSTIVVVATTILILVLKVFDIVFVMGRGRFGNDVIANRFITELMVNFHNGRAAALVVFLMALTIPFMIINIRRFREQEATR